MGNEPKPKPASSRKKRRHPPDEEIVDYIVEIETWDFGYWLALNTVRNALDPYHEHRHVEIKGRLLRPAGLKTDRVELSIFPSLNLLEERRKDLKPIAVGSLDSYPERIAGSVGIPSDALVLILQMLIAGRLKFVVMRGSKFRYRSARLVNYSLGTKLDEDDLVQLEGSG